MGAKGVPGIKLLLRIHAKIQMMFFNQRLQRSGTHMISFFPVSILQIKTVDPQLVWHHHIFIIRYSFCDPVMSSDCFQPPDLLLILKSNSIHFICSICFQKTSQSPYSFSRRSNIRKNNSHQIFLPNSTFYLRLIILGLFINHKRICTCNSCIDRQSLCCCHGYIFFIDSVSSPDSLHSITVWKVCILHRFLRKRNLYMRKYRFIKSGLVFRLHNLQPLGTKLSGRRIFVSCNNS